MSPEKQDTHEKQDTSGVKETPVPKESKSYVPMKDKMVGMGDVKQVEREEEKLIEKTTLAKLMKGMDYIARRDYVKARIDTLQDSVKHAGSGKEMRKASQTAEREALLDYVQSELNTLPKDPKDDTYNTGEQVPWFVGSGDYRAMLEPLKASLER